MGSDFLKQSDKTNLGLSIVIYLFYIALASVAIQQVTTSSDEFTRAAEIFASLTIAVSGVFLLIEGVVFLDRKYLDVK